MSRPSPRVVLRLAFPAGLVLLLSSAFFGGPVPLENHFLDRLRVESHRWNAERGNDRVYLQTDKPFYKPGETVRLTATIANADGRRAAHDDGRAGRSRRAGRPTLATERAARQGPGGFLRNRDNLVYLYFRQLPPGAQKAIHLDLKAELPGTFEAAASSAYLYYTDEVKSWSKPARITVLP